MFGRAMSFARLGKPDRAREIHDPGLMGQMYADPLLDPIRSDPRYQTLARELGFETARSGTSSPVS
jgi:hypothetical protein